VRFGHSARETDRVHVAGVGQSSVNVEYGKFHL
jgi:hypothetical protein